MIIIGYGTLSRVGGWPALPGLGLLAGSRRVLAALGALRYLAGRLTPYDRRCLMGSAPFSVRLFDFFNLRLGYLQYNTAEPSTVKQHKSASDQIRTD